MTLLDLPDIASDVIDDLDDVTIDDLTDVTIDVFGDRIGDGAAEVLAALGSDEDAPAVGTSYPRCADGNGTLTHLFFSDDEFDLARAKAICGKCGLASSCLAGALDRAEAYGIWGGHLVIEGEIIAVKRGRGRPPKQPRPPLVVDEVPLPPHLVA